MTGPLRGPEAAKEIVLFPINTVSGWSFSLLRSFIRNMFKLITLYPYCRISEFML